MISKQLLPCPPHLVPTCLKSPHCTLFLACKVKVKEAWDLVLLRDWLFEELGPPYMWTVMLSVVKWEHLTDNQKELHSAMRESWLSSYSKASHTVL